MKILKFTIPAILLILGCAESDIQHSENDNDTNHSNTTPEQTVPGDSSSNKDEKPNFNYNEIKPPDFQVETVYMPGGSFVNHDGEQIELEPFYASTHHVSISHFWDCLTSGGCKMNDIWPSAGEQFWSSGKIEDISHPVAGLKYHGAIDFCQWLGGHLMTEDEWEYTAMFDGEKLREVDYAWGNQVPEMCVDAIYCKPGYQCVLGTVEPSVLNCNDDRSRYDKQPYHASITPTGVYNMTGDNTADLVMDIQPNDTNTDNDDCNIHILKGGSYYSSFDHIKIRSREYYKECVDNKDDPYYYPALAISFRCAFSEAEYEK